MSNSIHPTAIISDTVELGSDVVVGPFCILDGHIKVGNGTEFKSHCVIKGKVSIGKKIGSFRFAPLVKSLKISPTKMKKPK